MMTNPFDDPGGMFVVLVNDENQHSLWPCFADMPGGWRSTYGPADRDACLRRIEESWTDMRPASLVRTMAGDNGESDSMPVRATEEPADSLEA